jgi:tetratricopeptide (TPR) repeat protein
MVRRIFRVSIFLSAVGFGAAGLQPADALQPAAQNSTPEKSAPREEKLSLDQLFSKLRNAESAELAKPFEQQIWYAWMHSGSPTIDLLMARTMKAMKAKNFAVALDLLDRVIRLKPDYAEGWNKRATVYFLNEDFAKSIADIERTLKLEPRHFGALDGLGRIFLQLGDKKSALHVFLKALDIHPTFKNAKKAAEKLKIEVDGKEI